MTRAVIALGWLRGLYSASVTTLRQSYVALLISVLAASLAGFLLGRFDEFLLLLPGLIIMVPGAVGMRGNIFSTLGSRLGTSMHLGLVDGLDLGNEHVRENIHAPLLLTLVLSVVLGFYAKAFADFSGAGSVGVSQFVVISIVAGVLSGVIMLALTFAVSFASFSRGLDPDNVTSPLIAAAGDLVTLPCLFVGAFLVLRNPEYVPTAFYFILFVFVACLFYCRRWCSCSVHRIFRQTASVMVFSSFLSSLAGAVLHKNAGMLFASPAVLVIVPAFLGCGGNIGGILSARLSTKLHLGLIDPALSAGNEVVKEFFVSMFLAVLVFPFVGLAGHFFTGLVGGVSPGVYGMVVLSTLSGLALTLVVTVMAFILSIMSYARGWNPDNVLMPLVSSSTDFLGVVTLLVSAVALGIA